MLVLAAILTLAVGALVALPAAADRPLVAGPDRVVPADQTVFGNSYADWAVAWWRWVFGTPADASPFGEGRVDCTTNQPDARVLFLTGPFNETGTVERTCDAAISTSTYIFLPVLNVECSNAEPGSPFFGATAADRLACLDQFSLTDLQSSFNRRAFPNLDDFVVTTPDFSFTATPDNRGGANPGPGQSTSRGAWLLLRPFPAGDYVVRFTGTVPEFDFTAAATYHITVR
jgi:hypothetical protein